MNRSDLIDELAARFTNLTRDMAQNIEIDVVALDEENKRVRFGTCKRSERAHDGASLVEFHKHVDAFLATKVTTQARFKRCSAIRRSRAEAVRP